MTESLRRSRIIRFHPKKGVKNHNGSNNRCGVQSNGFLDGCTPQFRPTNFVQDGAEGQKEVFRIRTFLWANDSNIVVQLNATGVQNGPFLF
jgi:hypothetical protein